MALRPTDELCTCLRCGDMFAPTSRHYCSDFRRTEPAPSSFQSFWRCAHYPSAINNFFAGRTSCGWLCHTQELQWHHGGEHPMPKSWGAPQPSVGALS
jgi:hypothetical protein